MDPEREGGGKKIMMEKRFEKLERMGGGRGILKKKLRGDFRKLSFLFFLSNHAFFSPSWFRAR